MFEILLLCRTTLTRALRCSYNAIMATRDWITAQEKLEGELIRIQEREHSGRYRMQHTRPLTEQQEHPFPGKEEQTNTGTEDQEGYSNDTIY